MKKMPSYPVLCAWICKATDRSANVIISLVRPFLVTCGHRGLNSNGTENSGKRGHAASFRASSGVRSGLRAPRATGSGKVKL